jgi:hypothetical protein
MFFKSTKDFWALLFFLFIAFLLVYFVPTSFNKILFLGVLPLIWRTKKDYFWLAFFFIVDDIPGGLFSGGLADDPYRLPLYTIASGISFSLRELYLILLFIKVLVKPEYRQSFQKNYFSKELLILFYYFLFLLFISILIGMTLNEFRNFYKISINLTLFVSVPLILKNRQNFLYFLRAIFPFAIIAILLQIYSLVYGHQLVAIFEPGITSVQGVLTGNNSIEHWQRPIEMVHVLLVCFCGTLFLINREEKYFKTGYLIIINILSFLGIFITGTRSWFLALTALYIFFFIMRFSQLSAVSLKRIFLIIALIAIISQVSVIKNQILNAWNRLSTIEKVAEGDITAGGTASRFDVRAPRVMEGFKESTIIAGAGFSKLYYEYADGHVGYHNMLLNAGITGMLLFFIIIAKAFILPYNLSKSKHISVQSKNELKASFLLLLALLIINTGTQTLGYEPWGNNRYLLMVFSLIFINQAVNNAMIEKYKYSQIMYKDYLMP